MKRWALQVFDQSTGEWSTVAIYDTREQAERNEKHYILSHTRVIACMK